MSERREPHWLVRALVPALCGAVLGAASCQVKIGERVAALEAAQPAIISSCARIESKVDRLLLENHR